jgi:thioredoxin-related protein
LVPIKVDAEKGEGPMLAARYGVSGFPTILFLDASGIAVHQIVGYRPPADFAEEMDRAMARSGN